MSKLFPNATIRTSSHIVLILLVVFTSRDFKQASSSMQLWRYFCADLTQVEDAEIANG